MTNKEHKGFLFLLNEKTLASYTQDPPQPHPA